MSLENISCQKSFGGWHKRYRHRSDVLGCDMVFAVYLPPQAEQGGKLPVLYWLSGLTCTDENFMQKAGAMRMAAELGLIIVAPDTSPRGADVPGDPDGAWDFGLGAGFYLNATQEPWSRHYRMHDYVVQELPSLVEAHFPYGQTQHQRPLHGRSRCVGLRIAKSWALSIGVGILAHQQSDGLSVGAEGVLPLPGRRPFQVERVGCLRLDR